MKRIAVVEDNPDNLMLVEAILSSQYEVSGFEDGPSALATLPDLDVALILLDISLPGMDGVAVLDQIRQNPALRDLPVIALTAHAMVGDREKYLGKGFDDYLTKPIIDFDELLTMIARHLN